MNDSTRAAIKAAAEFLDSDHARNLLGLHRIRVNGHMMTRGQLASLLQAQLATDPQLRSAVHDRMEGLERRIVALEQRTMPLMRLGGSTGA